MTTQEKTTITIDSTEYTYEDMTQEQQMLVNHIVDLEQKIAATQFNLDQFNVSKTAFIQLLKHGLTQKEQAA